jgi:hypothetical protein
MDELAMMVDLSWQVGIIFIRGFEDDFGSIGQVVTGKVDFAKRAFSNEFTKRVIAHVVQILRGKLSVVTVSLLRRAAFLGLDLLEKFCVRIRELFGKGGG